jgi:hypothetical protein
VAHGPAPGRALRDELDRVFGEAVALLAFVPALRAALQRVGHEQLNLRLGHGLDMPDLLLRPPVVRVGRMPAERTERILLAGLSPIVLMHLLGEHVVKIGLTRRLEPLDRINELGDASVPFRFDVHAIYFSEDAVKLENELHDHFASRRMNWANNRKEFFFASPVEVRSVLIEKVGNLLEFAEHCESTEYYQSVNSWPEEFRHPGPASAKL